MRNMLVGTADAGGPVEHSPPTFGITVPFFDHQHTFEQILAVTERTRAAGFDSVWVADHLTGPVPMGGAGNWFDCLTLLAHLAGRVPGLTYGTDVLVVGYRHPVQCAKALTTLDVVSGGHLVVGAGTGYLESEFAELGVPFAERGAYTDECLRVWDAMWSPGPANHSGRWFVLDDVHAEPKPVQRPRPPVWVANAADAVLRRAVALADGWHPLATSFAVLESGAARLGELCERADRERPLTLSCSGMFGSVGERAVTDEGGLPLTGGVDQVVADVARLQVLGFTNFVFRLGTETASNDAVLEQIDLVGERVLPQVRSSLDVA